MRYANITGWGKCTPPASLTNEDLATFLDTNDEWIVTRTGMKVRRISHVPVSELAYVACARALAAAGKSAQDVDMIIFGSCTYDEQVPNSASSVQQRLGCINTSSIDLNTACTSGMYALSFATSLIRTGSIKSALVIGAEVISPFMDWTNRNVAILFGDGAAAFYLEADNKRSGVTSESLGCLANDRDILAIRGAGSLYINKGISYGATTWDFVGRDIFKRAVMGMIQASERVLAKEQLKGSDLDLVVPHQANLRIIDALAKRLDIDYEKVFINIQRYGNMSAATAPMALVEAIEEGRVQPGSRILMPAFGAGLSLSAHMLQWGERILAQGTTDVDLPPCNKTGLELVQGIMASKKPV